MASSCLAGGHGVWWQVEAADRGEALALLPATMTLLGDRNWWLPKRLGWLPEIKHEGEVAPASA